MVPATRSGLDIAFWLLEKAASEKVQMTMPKLRWLLYLAQAHYAVAKLGAKLMPATFVINDDGPSEPTVELVLRSGVKTPWKPELNETALLFLEGFWVRFGALPAVALHRLIMADPAWKKGQDGGMGAELHVVEQHAHDRDPKPDTPAQDARKKSEIAAFEAEVKAKIAARGAGRHPLAKATRRDASEPKAADGHLRAVPPESQEVRFTADGRSVTRWKPKRKVSPVSQK